MKSQFVEFTDYRNAVVFVRASAVLRVTPNKWDDGRPCCSLCLGPGLSETVSGTAAQVLAKLAD